MAPKTRSNRIQGETSHVLSYNDMAEDYEAIFSNEERPNSLHGEHEDVRSQMLAVGVLGAIEALVDKISNSRLKKSPYKLHGVSDL